jgi:A/G-specific adenine glycosylase
MVLLSNNMQSAIRSSDIEYKEIPKEKIRLFQQKVLLFYRKNKRKLPWRQTTDPYKILLSECMLQQTQVTRVVSYYEKWIARWPTINALASASLPEVLEMWMGLGYNTRAVNLHRAAQKIVTHFDSDILKAMKQYKELPGIGKYTAQAVQIFATNADLFTVDTNIRRIFITEFSLPLHIPDTILWKIASDCLPEGKSRAWHNALMDYGALSLTAKKTGVKPKTQQSKFEGSDRQIRAKILRELLKKDSSISELEHALGLQKNRLTIILEKMRKEKLIIKQSSVYSIRK